MLLYNNTIEQLILVKNEITATGSKAIALSLMQNKGVKLLNLGMEIAFVSLPLQKITIRLVMTVHDLICKCCVKIQLFKQVCAQGTRS